MDKKKVTFWSIVGGIALFIIAFILSVISNNDKLLKKSYEMMGKSKANDEQRQDAVNKAGDTIKANEKTKEEVSATVKEEAQKTENLNQQINEQLAKNDAAVKETDYQSADSTIQAAKDLIEKNEKITGEK
jgi:uncharacterized membrane protein YhiD involved in acid resistance